MYVQDTVGGDKPNQEWKLLQCQLILPLILFYPSLCSLRHHWVKILEINVSLASTEKLTLNLQLKNSYYMNFSLFLFHTVVCACSLNSVIFISGYFLFFELGQLLQLWNTSFATTGIWPQLGSASHSVATISFVPVLLLKCKTAISSVRLETISRLKHPWPRLCFILGLAGVVEFLLNLAFCLGVEN